MAKSKSKAIFFTVFPTAWGAMGAAATDAGLCRVVLPHYQTNDLTDLLQWDHPLAKRNDQHFTQFILAVQNYFNGKVPDFSQISCDLPGVPGKESFFGKVYRAVRDIPFAQTRSYREVALGIGSEQGARPVATAMSKNPLPLIIPCHRVIYSDGRTGGFSAEGGIKLKLRLVAHEKGHGNSKLNMQ